MEFLLWKVTRKTRQPRKCRAGRSCNWTVAVLSIKQRCKNTQNQDWSLKSASLNIENEYLLGTLFALKSGQSKFIHNLNCGLNPDRSTMSGAIIGKIPTFAAVAMSNYISFGMVWVCFTHTIFDDERPGKLTAQQAEQKRPFYMVGIGIFFK